MFTLATRAELPSLLNAMELTGDGVEIGVQAGRFSEHLLRHSHLNRLFSVDPWMHWDAGYPDRANVSQAQQDARYLETILRCAHFRTRSVVMRMTSAQASAHFAPESLDFVYIDANHSFEATTEDLEHWWPKVKRAGLIAGDDFIDGRVGDAEFGVRSAVESFATRRGVQILVTTAKSGREARWPNWYAVKPA